MNRLIIPFVAGALLTSPLALGQFYGLDDNPLTPISGPPGFGMGAENPYGYIIPPLFNLPPGPAGLAPSPLLGALPCFDGDVIVTPTASPPVVHQASPGGLFGPYLDSLSVNTVDYNRWIRLGFSVDRLTQGQPTTDVNQQAVPNNEQPSDIFRSTAVFVPPQVFVTWPSGPFGYQGPLPTLASLMPTQDNMLDYDQQINFALQGFGPLGPATHDNIEQYERVITDANGDQLFDRWTYVTMYPDNIPLLPPPPPPIVQPIVTPADIFDVAPNTPGFPVAPTLPWANYTMMGLDQGFDSIDALVVYDNNVQGGPSNNGPGAEPAIDYALFSLAPGSQSLFQFQQPPLPPILLLSPGDVFFTNFTNGFWLYADARDLGLQPGLVVVSPQGGEYVFGDNLDALEVACSMDIDWDGLVGFNDLVQVLSAWGGPYTKHIADTDDNKMVDFNDLVAVLSAWGPCS